MIKDIQYMIKNTMKFLSDESYIKIAYFLKFKKRLNLKNPQTLNEKIQWLKLYDRKPLYNLLVDKYLVKDYISDQIGAEYVIPTLGKWYNFDDINFDNFPEQFVLKCNHDSGGIVICTDKKNFDKKKARKVIEKHLKRNYFWHGREWAYKDIKPVIIVEEYIKSSDEDDLKDYKFFCFNGKVKCFKVDCDRFTNHKAYYFGENKHVLPFSEKIFKPDNFNNPPELPDNITEMMGLAEKLAKDLRFARIDFYNVGGRILFGEITLYPASGMDVFDPEEWDKTMGEWLDLL